MGNEAIIHHDFLEIICRGDQTAQSVARVAAEAHRKAVAAWGDRPPLVYVDICKMGASSFTSRKAAMKSLRSLPFSKIAICAQSLFLRHVSELIIRAGRLAERVRVFKSRKEALEWLLSSSAITTDTT
jgi:hypothetical protein